MYKGWALQVFKNSALGFNTCSSCCSQWILDRRELLNSAIHYWRWDVEYSTAHIAELRMCLYRLAPFDSMFVISRLSLMDQTCFGSRFVWNYTTLDGTIQNSDQHTRFPHPRSKQTCGGQKSRSWYCSVSWNCEWILCSSLLKSDSCTRSVTVWTKSNLVHPLQDARKKKQRLCEIKNNFCFRNAFCMLRANWKIRRSECKRH